MQHKRISITLNLENDEQLNREINEIIRSRVIAVTRSDSDTSINRIVKDEVMRILGDRISKLNTDTGIKDIAKQIIRDHLTQVQGGQAIRAAVLSVVESSEFQGKINKLIENAVRYNCYKYVEEKIGNLVPENVITAVVNAMVKSGKEGETK